ncbi:MAG: hypothetical protein ACXADX_20140 [Candidatus Hodarchaeales archaeon]
MQQPIEDMLHFFLHFLGLAFFIPGLLWILNGGEYAPYGFPFMLFGIFILLLGRYGFGEKKERMKRVYKEEKLSKDEIYARIFAPKAHAKQDPDAEKEEEEAN